MFSKEERERFYSEHPEEYAAVVRRVERRELQQVNEEYLAKGYIKEPYKTFDEMMEKRIEDMPSRILTEEEKEQLFRNGIREERMRKKQRRKMTIQRFFERLMGKS